MGRAATVPDTFNPGFSNWRRARSVALRPLVGRLIADFRDSPLRDTGTKSNAASAQ
jgi:hypothetical protein